MPFDVFQLTDVEAGGATVFPTLKARVPAIKVRVFWATTQCQCITLHGRLGKISGSKQIHANKLGVLFKHFDELELN